MKKITLLNCLLVFSIIVAGQQVSTLLNSSTIQIDDAIVMDKHGNIYGSHYMGSNVYKIDKTGNISTFYSGLNTPNGLAFNSLGDLYIADNVGNKIYKVDSTGQLLQSITVNNPSGIIKMIDSDTMIITQYAPHAVRKLAPNGTILTTPIQYGYPLNGPVGLCYSNDSTLYIGNYGDRKIFKYVQDSLIYVAQIPGNSSVNLGFITYANGFIYGSSFQSNKIYEVDIRFIDSLRVYAGSSAGNLDGGLSVAKFNGPNGIYASKGGDSLLISDFYTGNLRLISGLLTGNKKLELKNEGIRAYPNPSTGVFTINSDWLIEKIEIYTIQGKLVYQNNSLQTFKKEFNLPNFKGLHLIRIQGSSQIEEIRVIGL